MPDYRNQNYNAEYQKPAKNLHNLILLAILAVALLIGLIFLLSSIRVVDATKSCTWVRFGKVIGNASPGLQFTNPFNKKVCFPYQSVLFQVARDMDGDGKLDSDAEFSDWPIDTNTSDGLSIKIEYNLTWHVSYDCASEVRLQWAMNDEDLVSRVLKNYGRSVPRDLAPKYTAPFLYGTGRIELESDIIEQLTPLLEARCVTMDSFNLRDIQFPEEYEAAINAQQIASEGIETQKYIADQAVYTAQATVTTARGAADAAIEAARGQAETARLLAQADADAMRLRGQALRDFPEMLQLQFFDTLKTSNWSIMPFDAIQGYLPLAK